MYNFGNHEENGTGCDLDVVIAGAGLIGLSVALEFTRRGRRVVVVERDRAMRQASTAAAGMLAAEDPHNPPGLLELSRYSQGLYPEYLRRIEELGGVTVPFQTAVTWQYTADQSRIRLAEPSLDPRQLAEALLAAVQAAGIELREGFTGPLPLKRGLVVASGAWSGEWKLGEGSLPVVPRKGQMLRVRIPAGLALTEVHRSERVYVVPRTLGPQAGTALIGATVEDAGFDVSTNAQDLARLRAWGAELVPELASEADAPMVEAWAGLRPATVDGIPLLGWMGEVMVATGHHRNGILLAPATAMVVADLMEGKAPAVDVRRFSPRQALVARAV